jgi:hypothetical protein
MTMEELYRELVEYYHSNQVREEQDIKMTENKIDILFAKFKNRPSVQEGVSEEEQIKFEQNRLKTIEDLARALVDYYNMNSYTKPKTLSLEVNKMNREEFDPYANYIITGRIYEMNEDLKKAEKSKKESEHNTEHKYLFDKYCYLILKSHLENNKEIEVPKIVDTAKALARAHLYEGHNLGNSPWDPR